MKRPIRLFCFVLSFLQVNVKKIQGCENSLRPENLHWCQPQMPTFSPKSFLCFHYQRNPGLPRWVWAYLSAERFWRFWAPERLDILVYMQCNFLELQRRGHTFECFIPLATAFLTSFHFFPLPPFLSGRYPLGQCLFMWLVLFFRDQDEKHNKGKGKVRLEKMQEFSAFLTDDVCSPGSLSVRRNSGVALNKSSSMCESVAV